MNEIIRLLPVLCVAMAMNIGTGIYYSVGTQKLRFNLNTLLSGLIKAIIVGLTFIGSAYCFEMTDLSSLGIDPKLIMLSAISLYVGKSLISLSKILGVDIGAKEKSKEENK